MSVTVPLYRQRQGNAAGIRRWFDHQMTLPLRERADWKRRRKPSERPAIVKTELFKRGFYIPSDAKFVRLCESVTDRSVRTGRPMSLRWLCFYPLAFYVDEPPASLPAGDVTCPHCGTRQPKKPDGTILPNSIYPLPPWSLYPGIRQKGEPKNVRDADVAA